MAATSRCTVNAKRPLTVADVQDRRAAAAHRIALALGLSDSEVMSDPAPALTDVLRGLGVRLPLRRRRDSQLLEAVRTLLPAVPAGDPRRVEVARALSAASRRACPQTWPPEVWWGAVPSSARTG